MNYLHRVVMTLLLFGALVGIAVEPSFAEQTSYKLAVTDIVGLEELQRDFGKFQKELSEKSGLSIELYPVTSRTVVVEALRSGRVDFVLTGPSEYVVLRSQTEADPIVAFSRPDYFSALVVKSTSDIHKLEDLKGKKVAFGDFGSTAYHLGPMQLIQDGGLKLSDIQVLNVSKHVGWEALKRDDVDALGIKHAQFLIFRDKEKDFRPGDFRVIARGPDLPNDVLVSAPHVPKSARQKLRTAITANSDQLIAAILSGGSETEKYRGMRFLDGVRDDDYDYVRSMYTTLGYPEFSKFIGEG